MGISKKKFESIKIETISTYLSEYFSPEIKWDLGLISIDGTYFGYIYIYESEDKPVICKKNSGKILKDGEIYYRYRGRTRTIEFPELKKIHIEIKERERKLWMSHVEKIAKIGPKNVAFIDLLDGQIESENLKGQFLIDESLLNELKSKVSFIKEGEFEERKGKPTLKVIGEIKSAKDVIVPTLDPNKDYPFLVKHLAQELQIRPYDVQLLIWKLNLKNNKKYSIEVQTSATGRVFKYSRFALKKLREVLMVISDLSNYLKQIGKEYINRRG